jgi:NAD-dependent deacetylase
MAAYKSIVILTGAGISAESGLATFRDAGGVWAKYDYRDVATPEGFARNPLLVHQFYNHRRAEVQKVAPNAAHYALAELEAHLAERGVNLTLITQNVDHLHEAAGSKKVVHMHGELLRCRRLDAGTVDGCRMSELRAAGRHAAGRRVVW